MKRIILIIGALLFGLTIQAQSVTYACCYWFDQNFAQATTATFSNSTWQAELDVGSLAEGLHTLHLHVMDTSMKWSAPQSYLFLKLTPPAASTDFTYYYWFDLDHTSMQSGVLGDGNFLLDVDELTAGIHTLHVMLKGEEYTASQNYLFFKADVWESGTPNYVYHCWFDEDFEHRVTNTLGDGNLLLDVEGLTDGLHTVHVMLEGNGLSSSQSYIFMKAGEFLPNPGNTGNLTYHCWFDEDFEHQHINSLGDGNLLLNVDDLEDGLHTVHVMLEGSTLTATQSYTFMKIAVEAPSTELQYVCWFDQDYGNAQTGPLGSGIFELEVGDLANGIHTVNVQLNNGTLTAPQTYVFYKRPIEGYTIARWEYWINDNFDNRTTTNLSPTVDTLEILSLLPVGHPAIRSSCFHFQPNGDEPYINAKNQITFRFFDNEYRFFDKSALYVDYQVSQSITAQAFERNTTETFAAPRDNQITWYKLDAAVGDSLTFVADKACTMQLFAPSGEEVYAVSGPESVTIGGCHAWEDGTYYLAVHDVTGSGENISITYNWIYRYAILAYDVHLVGNGGCSTITFQGNGFNSLLDVYLINAQNDTIRRIDIGHESNTITTVTLDFYQKNFGSYDAVFEYYGEIIRINGALEVQEPVDIVLTSSVSYPSTFRRGTECIYTYTITNNGNMSAYAVPIYVYISTPTETGISRLEFNGLNLPTLLDYFDLDSLSQNEIQELRQLSDEIKEDHYFLMYPAVDEDTGDSIVIRSNFFFLTLAPFETRTLSLKITSSEVLDVWMTVPNDIVWPIVTGNRNGSDQFCCSKERYACYFSLICAVLDYAELISGVFPGTPAAIGFSAASCICDIVSLVYSSISSSLCEKNPNESFFRKVHGINLNSIIGYATSCVTKFGISAKYIELLNLIGQLKTLIGTGVATTVIDCAISLSNQKSPDCPDGDSNGGKSTPVVPHEPNEIRGYLAESGSHYMMQEIQTITYEIESENDTTATAAAHTIIVRDTLDVNKFDVASLAANRVTIGNKVMNLHGENSFIYTLDLRPELNVIAQIQQECDPETGIVVWTITSLDPMTMEPTTDPNQGALPINYNGEGIATFTFNVNLKEPFPDGTAISNRVGIIFDLEEPVITDTWTNIVDAVKPVSQIEEVSVVADTLNFNFISSDNRSGVWYHTLYYRNDSTYQEWKVKVPKILENSYMLRFNEYQTTEYLVMAIDSAGNREEKDMVAEYTHYYDGPVPVSQISALSQGWNWWSTFIEGANPVELIQMLEASLSDNALQIKNSNVSTEYDSEWGWFGDLDEVGFTNEEMIMIKAAAACSVQLQGPPANPADHPITVNPGWNWIGYPCAEEMTLNQAFSNFTPEVGDMVKNSDGSSEYDSEWGWFGDVENLVPGHGFMYYSSSAVAKILVFQVGRNEDD